MFYDKISQTFRIGVALSQREYINSLVLPGTETETWTKTGPRTGTETETLDNSGNGERCKDLAGKKHHRDFCFETIGVLGGLEMSYCWLDIADLTSSWDSMASYVCRTYSPMVKSSKILRFLVGGLRLLLMATVYMVKCRWPVCATDITVMDLHHEMLVKI